MIQKRKHTQPQGWQRLEVTPHIARRAIRAGVRRSPGARRTATMLDAPKSPPWDRRISHLCRLGLSGPSKALIFRQYDIFSIDLFEPPHGEMTLSNLLKMLDKHVVHRSAAQCTNDWQSLCRELLRQHYSKARSHQRSEADENWSTLLDYTALQPWPNVSWEPPSLRCVSPVFPAQTWRACELYGVLSALLFVQLVASSVEP